MSAPRNPAGRPGAAPLLLGVALAGYAVLHRLGRVSGSTRDERRRRLPGDELIDRPTFLTDHAATLPVPPDLVWPWLTQVGWHRGGWYTPRWVDRVFFPANWPSATELGPEQRELHPGDTIPDGPPGTAEFIVETADKPHTLVLHSRTHLPVAWAQSLGASLDWVWTFHLAPAPGGRTRMHIRNRGTVSPGWLDLAYRTIITPADHIMTRGMFAGLRRRVAD